MAPVRPRVRRRLAMRVRAASIALALLMIAPALRGPGHVALAADDAEPDFKDELPRIAPLEPDDAVKSFEIKPPYRITLAAAEPVVADPVAMCFDEDGRLFIAEMRGYPESDADHLGQVRMLIDEDDDGHYEKSTLYVDKLSWPTAVFCWDGGVFIGAAPDIIYAKDTDGDGRADIRQRIFTGFGKGNVQGLLNSFRWGLDNRIHGAASSNGGNITRVIDHWPISSDSPLKPQASSPKSVPVRGRDFAFDPRTLAFEATAGGAQHGMSFDDVGRKFVCSNSDHLQMVMYESRYLARNPYLAAPGARLSIAADGGQAPVYRISPVEPWRIVRTRLRVAGKVPGPVEGGGTPAGYFTGSTGVTIYRGDAMHDLYGLAFIGDVGSNIVHRKKLEPNGVAFTGRRIDEKSEFLASRDIWFRPAQFDNGPDGCLYIADVYREVIEHPHSLPPVIKKHLDLTSGRGRGRIWRVEPQDFKRRATPKMSEATTQQLVKHLVHPNAWHRETAARLIYQRQPKNAPAMLREAVRRARHPFGPPIDSAHLFALHGLNALDENSLVLAMDIGLYEDIIPLAEAFNLASPEMHARLSDLVDHAEPRFRYQAAFTLGEMRDPRRIDLLLRLLARDGNDRWMRMAILSSVSPYEGGMLARLLAGETALKNHAAFIDELTTITGRFNHPTQVSAAITALNKLAKTDAALAMKLRGNLDAALAKAVTARKAGNIDAAPPVAVERSPEKIAALDKLYEQLKPALQLEGDAERGKVIFTQRCATCHKVAGVGQEIGPNLAAMAARGAEAVLLNVIDPNREVNPQYLNYIAETKDGDTLTGLIGDETVNSITLVRANNDKSTLLRVDIAELRTTGLSLMPEELTKDLDQQAVADLITFLLRAGSSK